MKIVSKIETPYNKVRSFFLTDYPLSVWAIIKFFLMAIGTFLIFFVTFYFTLQLTLPDNKDLTWQQWIVISKGSLILLIITYFLNKLRD